MRELPAARDVAGGVDALVRRAEHRVDHNALVVRFDTGEVEAKPVDARRFTDSDEDAVEVDGGAVCKRHLPRGPATSVAASNALKLCIQPHVDAVAAQRVQHDGGGVGIVLFEQPRAALDERDGRAKAGEGLAHLAADRPAADDQQSRRKLR